MKRLSIILFAGVVLLTSACLECQDVSRQTPAQRKINQDEKKRQHANQPTNVRRDKTIPQIKANDTNNGSGWLSNAQARLRNFGRSFQQVPTNIDPKVPTNIDPMKLQFERPLSARELEGRARAARYEEAYATRGQPMDQRPYRARAFDPEAYEAFKEGRVDKVEPRYGRYLRNKIPSIPTELPLTKRAQQKQAEIRKERGLARAEAYDRDYAERTPVYGSRTQEERAQQRAQVYEPRVGGLTQAKTRAQEYDDAYKYDNAYNNPKGFVGRKLEDWHNAGYIPSSEQIQAAPGKAWRAAGSWLGDKASDAKSYLGSYFSRGQQPDYRENAAGEYNESDERAYAEFIEKQRLEDQLKALENRQEAYKARLRRLATPAGVTPGTEWWRANRRP